jgi:hypothetical protein
MKNLATATCIALGLAAFSSASLAATVNIAGTQSTVNYHPVIDTSVLFDPNSGPVTASGTIDLSSMGSSGVLFVGLISKVDYDLHLAYFGGDTNANFFGFVDTAYGAFTNTTNKVAGLGQYKQSGETTQTYISAATAPVTAFDIAFGDTSATLTVQSIIVMLNYDFNNDTLTFTNDGSPYTDFSQGAYAFVGAYLAGATPGSATYDVTFSGPELTPLPAALPLFGSGLGLLGLIALKRRRRSAAV